MANITITRLNKFNKNSIMIHSADAMLSINHIKFWLDTISTYGKDFSILVRDESSYNKLTKEFSRLQICYAKAPVDVETVVNAQSDLKIILYTSNMARNIHLLRFNHLKHIFIGTKNSDWLSQYNKSYRAYDELWLSGEFVVGKIKEEIQNTGHLKFKIIGTPQIKEIISSTYKEEKSNLILIDNDNELLLEQIYFANKSLDNKMYIYLNEEKRVVKTDLMNVAKSHNFTSKIQIFNDKNVLDEFANKVSLIITDLKNLNPYLLQYNVPIIVNIEKENDKYLIDIDILRNSLYYFSNKNELLEILREIESHDSLKDEREKNLNKFFNQQAILEDKFLTTVKECLLKD